MQGWSRTCVTRSTTDRRRLRWAGTLGFALAFASLSGSAAVGQPPPPPTEQLEAIDQLAAILGEWEGAGWIEMGPGRRSEFRQTESVREASGGTTVLVEGRGTADLGGREVVVHDALAVISWDVAEKVYRFSSHTGRGDHHDSPLSVDGETLVWGLETPRGSVRFTITVADGKWHEVGEGSSDGESWAKFLEMNLLEK